MRRRITVLDKDKVRVTKQHVSFLIDELPYSYPRQNIGIEGSDFLVPENIFTGKMSMLAELDPKSFVISEPENPTYNHKESKQFADWRRIFTHKKEKFLVFGFDKMPQITIESKYSAILATYSDEQLEEVMRSLNYEFDVIEGVLSTVHYEYIGDLYEIVENKREAKLPLDDFRSACRKYVPEVFKRWDGEPNESDYENEFAYRQEQAEYEIAAKETFIICRQIK